MTDAPAHSSTHFNKQESFMSPPPPLNDRYYGVLYDVCTKQTQYKEVEGEEEGGRGEKREKTDR